MDVATRQQKRKQDEAFGKEKQFSFLSFLGDGDQSDVEEDEKGNEFEASDEDGYGSDFDEEEEDEEDEDCSDISYPHFRGPRELSPAGSIRGKDVSFGFVEYGLSESIEAVEPPAEGITKEKFCELNGKRKKSAFSRLRKETTHGKGRISPIPSVRSHILKEGKRCPEFKLVLRKDEAKDTDSMTGGKEALESSLDLALEADFMQAYQQYSESFFAAMNVLDVEEVKESIKGFWCRVSVFRPLFLDTFVTKQILLFDDRIYTVRLDHPTLRCSLMDLVQDLDEVLLPSPWEPCALMADNASEPIIELCKGLPQWLHRASLFSLPPAFREAKFKGNQSS